MPIKVTKSDLSVVYCTKCAGCGQWLYSMGEKEPERFYCSVCDTYTTDYNARKITDFVSRKDKENLQKKSKEPEQKVKQEKDIYYSVTCANCRRQLLSEVNKRQETYGCECGAITNAAGILVNPPFKKRDSDAQGTDWYIYRSKTSAGFNSTLKSLNTKQNFRCPVCDLAASGMLPYDYFYCSECKMFIKLLPEMNNKEFESLGVADYGRMLIAKFEASQQGEAKSKEDSKVDLWLCVNCGGGKVELLTPKYGAKCSTCNTYYAVEDDGKSYPISYTRWGEKERERIFGLTPITRTQKELAQISRMKERRVVATPSIYDLTRNLTKEEVALIRKVIEEGELEIERASNLILKPQATPEREVIRRRIILDDSE